MTLWRRSQALRVTTWIVVALVVLFVTPWGYLYWRTGRDLERELQRIRDAGEPVSLDEIVPPKVPDEQNAALVYERYYADVAPWPALSFGPSPDAEIISDFLANGASEAQARQILSRPEVADGLDAIREASRLPSAVPAQATGPGSSTARTAANNAATWLGARAVLAARDGEGEQALRWVSAIFRISRQIAADPLSGLVSDRTEGIARDAGWRVLEETVVPPDAAVELLTAIEAPDPEARARHQLAVWRAQILDEFRMADADPLVLSHGVNPADFRPGRWALLSYYDRPLLRPVRNADELCILENIGDAMAAVSVVQPVVPARQTREICQHPKPLSLLPVSSHYYDFNWLVASDRRDAARVNMFRAALALVAHKGEHGEYPKALRDVDLPDGIDPTEDPFSASSLKYRRQGDGFEIHSVGPNGRDESGGADDIGEGLGR